MPALSPTSPQARAATPPDSPAATRAAPRRRTVRLPGWRQAWFQLHWLIGITAGSVMMLIGLSGALLAFREEILDAVNPGVRHVAPRAAPVLTPAQLLSAALRDGHGQRVNTIMLGNAPGAAARVIYAPPPGERRGESVYLDPYSGARQPALRGAEVVEWVEDLHRWLLLPREPGRMVAGTLALLLMGMAASGLYLRWPRRALDWRTWLTFDPALRGRPFLWHLHAVAGTWVLPLYLVLAATGIYWSFDVVRDNIDAWAGRPPREASRAGPAKAKDRKALPAKAGAPDLEPAWRAFLERAPRWQQATLRVPEQPGKALQINWLEQDAPHERARSRMVIQADGRVTQDERYAAQGLADRALSTIYPLHMGTYFGLPGRIAMMLAALALPGFGVTGWTLYLKRRAGKRAVLAERAGLQAAAAGARGAAVAPGAVLVAWASQTGTAERLATRSAAALVGAGGAVELRPLEQLEPPELARYDRILLAVSTHGDGEAPDGARRFWQRLSQPGAPSLAGVSIGVLALGDRNYSDYCGFGRKLEQRLQALGAQPLFPMVEVDNGDPAALERWSARLAGMGARQVALADTVPASAWQSWRLVERTLLNPGSQGGPLFEIALHGPARDWQAGDLVDILPPQAGAAPRSYSVASLPADGALRLLVRQERHADGLGLCSGWLTDAAAMGEAIPLRHRPNPGFRAAAGTDAGLPAIYIGNGSGLAGLRAHLRARAAAGQSRNWLLFGERQQAHDQLCADEIAAWQAAGMLPQLDLVYSRDGAHREYVQDRLRARAAEVRAWLDQGAVVYVCGSLQGMAAGVDAALTQILGQDGMQQLAAQGRYRRDVY
ncbi:PepSY domain-containing protein [Oxalobacteraceae bacterium A2-2]